MMAAAGQIRPMQAAGMPPQMAVAAQQQNAAAVAAAMANPQRANYKYTQGVRNPAQVAAAGMPPQAVPPQALAAAQAAAAQPAVLIQGQEPLTASMLASAPPQEQKQMLGERLFPLIQGMYPELAGKITGEFQIYSLHAFLFFSVQTVNFFCNYRQSCSFVLSKQKLYSINRTIRAGEMVRHEIFHT